MTVDKEREFWDQQCSSMESAKGSIAADESAWSGVFLEASLEQILPTLIKHCTDRSYVLDLGCGLGRLAIPIAQRHPWRVSGIDVSPRMIELAKTMHDGWRVEWMVGDGRTLRVYQDSLFDAVYSMIAFQHVSREAQVGYIHEAARVLLPGGVFRFQTLEGTGESFMWAEVDEPFLRKACTLAGLEITALDRVKPLAGGDDACVLWVTAIKPIVSPRVVELAADTPKPKASKKSPAKKAAKRTGKKS